MRLIQEAQAALGQDGSLGPNHPMAAIKCGPNNPLAAIYGACPGPVTPGGGIKPFYDPPAKLRFTRGASTQEMTVTPHQHGTVAGNEPLNMDLLGLREREQQTWVGPCADYTWAKAGSSEGGNANENL
ncbi:hypothetical protein JX266_014087 [Neoarthrinium moseri]|nr:hypothetical protein JX266_014087 [Neoarthrinium moseri]